MSRFLPLLPSVFALLQMSSAFALEPARDDGPLAECGRSLALAPILGGGEGMFLPKLVRFRGEPGILLLSGSGFYFKACDSVSESKGRYTGVRTVSCRAAGAPAADEGIVLTVDDAGNSGSGVMQSLRRKSGGRGPVGLTKTDAERILIPEILDRMESIAGSVSRHVGEIEEKGIDRFDKSAAESYRYFVVYADAQRALRRFLDGWGPDWEKATDTPEGRDRLMRELAAAIGILRRSCSSGCSEYLETALAALVRQKNEWVRLERGMRDSRDRGRANLRAALVASMKEAGEAMQGYAEDLSSQLASCRELADGYPGLAKAHASAEAALSAVPLNPYWPSSGFRDDFRSRRMKDLSYSPGKFESLQPLLSE